MWLVCEKANLGGSKALPLKYDCSVATLCILSLGIPWLPEASFCS